MTTPSRFHVFLDTSTIRRDPYFKKVRAKRFLQLCEADIIRVYISEVVYQEWLSSFADNLSDCVDRTCSAIRSLINHPCYQQIEKQEQLPKTLTVVESLQVRTLASQLLEDIFKSLKAKIVEVRDHHGKNVVHSYFSGTPPFKIPKSRQDFPDAFIYQSAADLKDEIGSDLHCIIHDEKLRQTCSEQGMPVYSNLQEFVTSFPIETVTQGLEREQVWKEIVQTVISKLPTIEQKLRDDLRDPTNFLASREITHSQIPSGDDTAWIAGVYATDEIEFAWGDVEDLGLGILLLPFNITCEADLVFRLHREEALSPPQGVWVQTNFDEPFWDAGGEVILLAEGLISIDFKIAYIEPHEIELLREDPDFLGCEVNVEDTYNLDIVEFQYGQIFH